MIYVLIMIGSAIGGVARYWLSGVVSRCFGESFPWGTLLVNISGCFVIGFFATITAPGDGRLFLDSQTRQFVMIGLCGGYTTFSSFGLQTLNLARGGEAFAALANIGLSFGLCLFAVWLGHIAAAHLNELKGA